MRKMFQFLSKCPIQGIASPPVPAHLCIMPSSKQITMTPPMPVQQDRGSVLPGLMDILKSFDLKKKKKDKKKCCEKFRKGKRCGSCPMKGCA